MNELSKIKNCLSVKEKRVNISNSKNRNKCGAKVLALMLSAVNLFPGITPYANAADVKEEAKSENSVVRKIKDAGEYVSSLAKRGYTNAITWAKKHPKIATGISAGTLLAIIAAIGGLYYKSLEKSSDESEPKGNNDGQPGVNLNELANVKRLLEETPTSLTKEKYEAIKKLLDKLSKENSKNLNSYITDLECLKERVDKLIKKRKKAVMVTNAGINKDLEECLTSIDSLIGGLKSRKFEESLLVNFNEARIKSIEALRKANWLYNDSKLREDLEENGECLLRNYRAISSDDETINGLREQIREYEDIHGTGKE